MANLTRKPKVSVIIPTYNRAQTVSRAVQSAFDQEDTSVEVIVIDDGSIDETADVLTSLQSKYGTSLRVRYQENAGASAARNVGLELARGTYIQFLDSDDTLDPRKLKMQLAAFSEDPENTVVLCHGWLEEEYSEKKICDNRGSSPQSYIEAICGTEVHVIPTLSPLWKKSLFSSGIRWNSNISLGDDAEFHIRCLSKTHKIGFVPLSLFRVHWHQGDRLSNFAANDERLSSLLFTRKTIYSELVQVGMWSTDCALQMRKALRSLYVVYLQRMNDNDVAEFDHIARQICGKNWHGVDVLALKILRRLVGAKATHRALEKVLFARSWIRKLAKAQFAGKIKSIIRRHRRIDLRHEYQSWRNSRLQTLNYPKPQTALYVELNDFHGEIIPGYVSLLAYQGYEITVIHRPSLDAPGALSRLPRSINFQLIPLTLYSLRRFLRTAAPQRYDYILFGSGTLAEKDKYWGGIFDFIGTIPRGQMGHVVIEHSIENFMSRGDKLSSASIFSLRKVDLEFTRLPMLAPLEFGWMASNAISQPIIFAVVGRLKAESRDVEGLFSAVRDMIGKNGPRFEIHLIGDGSLHDVPYDIRPVFRTLGRLPFERFYQAIDSAHYLLPLLDSESASHRIYLKQTTTGTRQLSLGFSKPMVMDRVFSSAYYLDQSTCVIHEPGRLCDGLEMARCLKQSDYERLQIALQQMKADLIAESQRNLDRHIRANSLIGHDSLLAQNV